MTSAYVPVAVTDRSGFDESVHHGAVVVLGVDGTVVASAGDPDVAVYARSAMKPLQAVAMLGAGLQLVPQQLALVCASHDGSPRHLELVRALLGGAGLDETALATTPGLPYDREAARDVVRAGGAATALTMNCSGKHAGMLATCVANGWSTEGYLAPDHPLQAHITTTIAELIGHVAHIGVDGCGAPAHVVRLSDLARGFADLGRGGGPVVSAMTGHPDLVGGPQRPVSMLMRHVEGLVAKDGAEGVFAAALPDGRAVAVKIADGAQRAVVPVVLDALRRARIDVSAASAVLDVPVMGHGRPVGRVRSLVGAAFGDT